MVVFSQSLKSHWAHQSVVVLTHEKLNRAITIKAGVVDLALSKDPARAW